MSWLFTIVFSGLLFSSNSGVAETAPAVVPGEVPQASAPLVVPAGDETERFEQTYPLTANGRVSVSNDNGSIVVEAWDRNEVQIVAVKTAESKERLADVEIKVDAKPDSITIDTDYGDWKRRNNGDRWNNRGKLEVNYNLMVPRGAVLNEVETVNGSVTVSNFTNLTRISAVNGTVKATNLRGTANLSTVNGEVFADFDRLDSGSKISLETVNGRVNLVIPSDANATIRADSLNGVITNDFGLPVRKGKYVGRDLYGKVGTGEVHIKLDSVNGGLTIGRKSDGKTLNPATNLLPQKEKDDEDWDDHDEDTAKAEAKGNRDIERSVRVNARIPARELERIQRDAERAMEKSRVEMERIKPELARIKAEADMSVAAVVNSKAVQDSIRAGLAMEKDIVAAYADANYRAAVPRIEKKSNAFAVKGVPTVTVEANGCSVKVIGTDTNEVRYTIIQSSSNRGAKGVEINEQHSDSSVGIKVVNADPDARDGGYFGDRNSVRIEIYVPKKSNLKITTNGEIRLEGVTGEIDLTGNDQSINVRDVDGTLRVGTLNGRIRVIGFHGEIDARSAEGELNLEGDFTKLSARTDSGDVVLTLPASTNADIDSQETDIRTDGIRLERNDADAKNESENRRYRVGKGGKQFRIVTDGEILVRGQTVLTAGL